MVDTKKFPCQAALSKGGELASSEPPQPPHERILHFVCMLARVMHDSIRDC